MHAASFVVIAVSILSVVTEITRFSMLNTCYDCNYSIVMELGLVGSASESSDWHDSVVEHKVLGQPQDHNKQPGGSYWS